MQVSITCVGLERIIYSSTSVEGYNSVCLCVISRNFCTFNAHHYLWVFVGRTRRLFTEQNKSGMSCYFSNHENLSNIKTIDEYVLTYFSVLQWILYFFIGTAWCQLSYFLILDVLIMYKVKPDLEDFQYDTFISYLFFIQFMHVWIYMFIYAIVVTCWFAQRLMINRYL